MGSAKKEEKIHLVGLRFTEAEFKKLQKLGKAKGYPKVASITKKIVIDTIYG